MGAIMAPLPLRVLPRASARACFQVPSIRAACRLHSLIAVSLGCLALVPSLAAAPADWWKRVEIIRTEHGVPHVRADDLQAAGYALGWLQCEDYGLVTPERLWSARGQTARVLGRRAVEADFEAQRRRERAIATYHLLDPETRDFDDGFAAGVNRYIELHRAEFPAHITDDYTGYDVAALSIGTGAGTTRRRRAGPAARDEVITPEPPVPGSDTKDGSNAWAFAPSRTQSGKAILLRNPHLDWTAGYYEIHLTVPGILDFYGDVRIGGPLLVVGGFNRNLGWSTTNSNTRDLTEIYTVPIDPAHPDHYQLDGASLPLSRTSRSVAYKDGDGEKTETREFLETPLGPAINLTKSTVQIVRTAGEGEFRSGEQFLRLMRARSLDEWLAGMKLRAKVDQNYTYADRAGNILILNNASLPLLPHPPGRGTPISVTSLREMWTRYIPFEDLPQVLNPPGGYVHNENSSPHFDNVRLPLVLTNKHPNMERPSLSLRSQLAIELIDNDEKYSLEDVVRLKHSYRALQADRVKADLLRALEATKPNGAVAAGLELLRHWDNTLSPDSRGSVLFWQWWEKYSQGHQLRDLYTAPWSESEPRTTPRGLALPTRAVAAFEEAVNAVTKDFGRLDVTWGEVFRLRRGAVDVPIGGGPNELGTFRVLNFARQSDGKYAATGGDGWVLAVEFGDEPRAYSVLAYGESSKPASPWHADQAAMFAKGEVKPVWFKAQDVDQHAVTRYRPGAPQ